MMDRREDISFNTMAFPSKLYAMLEDAESQGFTCVVSWQPGGRSFNVHDQQSFSNSIIQAYFSQTKFKSFQRQLNIYGWKKVQLGSNKGGYEHKNFVRGQPELCELIIRKKDMRPRSGQQQTESSHLAPLPCGIPMNPLTNVLPLTTSTMGTTTSGALHLQSSHMIKTMADETMALSEAEVHTFYNFFCSGQSTSTSSSARILASTRDSIGENLFLLDPTPLNPDTTAISIITKAIDKFSVDFLQSEEMNEIDDFISLLDELPDQDCDGMSSSRAEDDEVVLAMSTTTTEEERMKLDNDDTLESDHSFPFKLHLMLDNAERENYSSIVSWVNEGTAFKVHDTKAFVDRVMPYFDQSKYESFRRQLNLYQFKRVAKGEDRGVISHPNLTQGSRHLCKDITRKKNEDGLLPWSHFLA